LSEKEDCASRDKTLNDMTNHFLLITASSELPPICQIIQDIVLDLYMTIQRVERWCVLEFSVSVSSWCRRCAAWDCVLCEPKRRDDL